MDERKSLEKLASGIVGVWPEVAQEVKAGHITTYHALRALETGVSSIVPKFRAALKEGYDKDYWENQISESYRVLQELNTPEIHMVSYNGISLEKK